MTSRRSIMLGLVLGAFLSVVGFNSVYAQVPRSISYQGLLVKNNQPVNGAVNLDIIIYDAAGTNLYEETYSGVNATNGLFTVVLGASKGLGTLKFDEQYYLGINVDGAGELPQRTPFTAAPYALNSQTVGGVGVSVTPQAGMLIPLGPNGKFPIGVLPQSGTAPVTSLDGTVVPDNTGNIKIVGGTNVSIVDGLNQITINAAGGGGIQSVLAGPGLTGGVAFPQTTGTIGIAQNGITNAMLGNGIVTARNLDQNIPQFGLYMDQFGQLNVGIDPSFQYYQFGTSTGSPSQPLRNIGLNLSHSNTWLALQTFNGGITVNGTTLLNGPVILTPGTLTINGTPEPLAGPNGATYEIQDNGDLRVTGSTTTWGNTYLGVGPTNNANSFGTGQTTIGNTNTIGSAGFSANTIAGNTNALNASGANSTNTITAGTGNSIQSPANTIGTSQSAGNTNTVGTAGNSANTVTGATNTVTATASNNLVSIANNIGTTTSGSVNTIGNAGTSSNTVTGATNNVTGTTANNVQAPTNNVGTTQVAGGVNNIGTAGISANTVNGTVNTANGTVSNNSQAPLINVGTTQVAGGTVNVGTANVTTTNINGLANNVQSQTNSIGTSQVAGGSNNIGTAGISTNNINGLTNNSQAQTINVGSTQAAGGAINIGNNPNSTVTINGTTNHNGPNNFNGNITQTSGTSTLLNTQTGNLTVIGTLTQSGGNAQIAGGATNTFGSVASSINTIGGAGSANTMTGASNTLTGTVSDNISAPTVTITGNTTSTGGTFTTTGNSFIGTTSTTNIIGAAGSSANTMTGQTNTITATTGGNTFSVGAGAANNFTGDIVQASGRVSIAPTASTTNNFGTGASQINNFGTGASTANNIGSGSGSVNNIGVVSGGGISTNNIGNLNAGTNNNINGTATFQGATLGNSQIVRITGGPQSCAGPLPTSTTSQLFADGDAWFAGTLSACRLNIFGVSSSCITNLNTTNFGACAGGATQIVLISGINGNAVPNANPINITNIDNIQANTNIKSNSYFTAGTGVGTTNISPALAGSRTLPTVVVGGQDNTGTPSVSGRMPTFQTYTATLIAGTGPHGGGAVSFTNVTGTPNASAAAFPPSGTEMGLNFDNNSSITVTYRSPGALGPMGTLNVTTNGTTYITVESSAAGDNNTVQITVLRP